MRLIINRWQILRLMFILLLGVGGCSVSKAFVNSYKFSIPFSKNKQSELRGVWVQAKSIMTREGIDEVLRQVETGKFNTIFAGVFIDGQTLYQSKIAPKHIEVGVDFDPLAYLVSQAHVRNVEVHAWFVVGRISKEEDSQILVEHPEWKLVGPDGNTTNWLNFTRPDVREFVTDLVKEVIKDYNVDGIHFDYLRYPGPEWGFDPYSVELFAKEYGFDLNELRYTDLPAFGRFESNPLTDPASAQVLATFSNGIPAITLNQYGAGEVILMNWKAHERKTAIGSEILLRGFQRLLEEGGKVYLLRSETNIKEYGVRGLEMVVDWLKNLGWSPVEISETNIVDIPPESVLVIPAVYLISPDTAAQMMDFVSRGGGIIFIDGPTRSIHLAEIQQITGMNGRSRYYNEDLLMVAVGEHPLVPGSQRDANLEVYQSREYQSKEFRRQFINALLKDVHEYITANHQEVTISVTIGSNQNRAIEEVLQDWPAWLEGNYVDFIIIRAYIEEIAELQLAFNTWLPIIDDYDRIIFGLSAHVDKGESKITKSADQLLAEMRIVRASGSNGVVIFNLGTMSEEQLEAFASYPFSSFGAVVRE